MKWKSVFLISSEVTISDGNYVLHASKLEIVSFPPDSIPASRDKIKLLTVFFDADSHLQIEEIYLQNKETAEGFLNRVSLLGYCGAAILNHIITTIEKVPIGTEFEVLSTYVAHNRKYRFDIKPSDFEKIKKIEPTDYLEFALTFLRRALATNSLEEKIIMLASCLERIGSEESQDFVSVTCEKCGHVKSTNNKSTKKFLKALLVELGANPKDVSNFLDRDRNKVAHGGGKRDVTFYSDLKDSILKIQHIVVELIANRLDASLINSITSIVDLGAVKYKFKCLVNQTYERSGDIVFSSMAGISKVSNAPEVATKNVSIEFGVSFEPNENPILDPVFQKSYFPRPILK